MGLTIISSTSSLVLCNLIDLWLKPIVSSDQLSVEAVVEYKILLRFATSKYLKLGYGLHSQNTENSSIWGETPYGVLKNPEKSSTCPRFLSSRNFCRYQESVWDCYAGKKNFSSINVGLVVGVL